MKYFLCALLGLGTLGLDQWVKGWTVSHFAAPAPDVLYATADPQGHHPVFFQSAHLHGTGAAAQNRMIPSSFYQKGNRKRTHRPFPVPIFSKELRKVVPVDLQSLRPGADTDPGGIPCERLQREKPAIRRTHRLLPMGPYSGAHPLTHGLPTNPVCEERLL